ncbi:MAG: hypothetical protein AAF806_19980 [Bacteroidota bacterium]
MKISIGHLRYYFNSYLETNFFEAQSTSIQWLPQLTSATTYLQKQNQQKKLAAINIPDWNFWESCDSNNAVPSSPDRNTALSSKELKKLNRLSKLLYSIDEQNNIEPTDIVQSYFKHKTLYDKAQLDVKIKEHSNRSKEVKKEEDLEQAFQNWCDFGYKYEYEQILYFFKQIGTLVLAEASDYFLSTTRSPETQFSNTTYLPFKTLDQSELWSKVDLPIEVLVNTQEKVQKSVDVSFQFTQIPIITPHFPSASKMNPSIISRTCLKSILLLKNVNINRAQGQLLEDAFGEDELFVLGFKYEMI